MKHDLFGREEIAPGELRRVQVDNVAIVVACTPRGELFALRGVCPHMGASLQHGRLEQRVHCDESDRPFLSDEEFVVRCPWHGFEFELATGHCPADPEHVRVKTYKVSVEEARVVLER